MIGISKNENDSLFMLDVYSCNFYLVYMVCYK